MTAGTDALIQAFRLWVTDKVPASGANWPNKTEIIAGLTRLAVDIGAAQAGLTTVSTTAQRDTFYADAGNRGKLVYVNNNNGSATDPANGVYEYVGGARLAQGFYAGVAAIVQPLVDQAVAAAATATTAAATATAQAPRLAVLNADTVDNAIAGVNPPTAGAGALSLGRTFITSAKPGAGFFKRAGIYVSAPGNVEPAFFTLSSTGQYKTVWRNGANIALTGAAGEKIIDASMLASVPEATDDWLWGFYVPASGGATARYAAGGSNQQLVGDPGAVGTINAYTANGQTVQSWVQTSVRGLDTEKVARKVGDAPGNQAFQTQRRNRPAKDTATVIGTGLTAGAPDQTFVMVRPFLNNGSVGKLRLNISAVGGGTFDIFPVDRITTTTFQVGVDKAGNIIRRTLSVSKPGWNDLYAGVDYDIFDVRRTQFIGVKIPAGSGLRFVGVAGGAYYTFAGDGAVIDGSTGKPLVFTGSGAAVEPQIIVSTTYDQSRLIMPWVDQAAGFLGDSITAMAAFGQGYTKALCDATGLTEAMNKGVVGQLIATMADGVSASDLANIKLISLLGGTNDYGHGNKPLGNPTDPISKTATVCSSLKYVIDTIMTLKPSLTFVVSTPTYRTQYSGAPTEPYPPAAGGGVAGSLYTMPQLVDAMMATCQEMNIPCFNAYRNGGLNRWNILDKAPDGLHPNISPIAAEYAGAEVLGRAYGRFINGIVPLY